jgi:hypothetical protein
MIEVSSLCLVRLYEKGEMNPQRATRKWRLFSDVAFGITPSTLKIKMYSLDTRVDIVVLKYI